MSIAEDFQRLESLSKDFQSESYKIKQIWNHAHDSKGRIKDSHPKDFEFLKELESIFEGDSNPYWDFANVVGNLEFWEQNYEEKNYIALYNQVEKFLVAGERFEGWISKFFEEERQLQIYKFAEYLKDKKGLSKKKAINKAENILKAEIEGKDSAQGHKAVQDAVNKGYLEGGEAFHVWKDIKEIIFVTEEELEVAKALISELEQLIYDYAEQIDNRPKILLSEQALKRGNEVVRQKTMGHNAVETAAVMEISKIKRGEILVKGFEDIESDDYDDSTIPNYSAQLTLNQNKELVMWHSHPAQDGNDTLSKSDLKGMSNKGGFGMSALKQEIGMIATPWPGSTPKEDVVWVAGMVSMKGESLGYFPMNVVKVSRDSENNIQGYDVLDGRYSWVKKYNKGIKLAMMTSKKRYGPYRVFEEVRISDNLDMSRI